MIIFDVTPVGKPRMTQRDKWLDPPRPPVAQYWAFKQELNLKANLKRFVLGKSIGVIFLIPMPASWSATKKHYMMGASHEQKPDTDNLLKSFCDALTDDDSKIWSKEGRKYWWSEGKIIVTKNEHESGILHEIKELLALRDLPEILNKNAT